jgi:hypothetical protein
MDSPWRFEFLNQPLVRFKLFNKTPPFPWRGPSSIERKRMKMRKLLCCNLTSAVVNFKNMISVLAWLEREASILTSLAWLRIVILQNGTSKRGAIPRAHTCISIIKPPQRTYEYESQAARVIGGLLGQVDDSRSRPLGD